MALFSVEAMLRGYHVDRIPGLLYWRAIASVRILSQDLVYLFFMFD